MVELVELVGLGLTTLTCLAVISTPYGTTSVTSQGLHAATIWLARSGWLGWLVWLFWLFWSNIAGQCRHRTQILLNHDASTTVASSQPGRHNWYTIRPASWSFSKSNSLLAELEGCSWRKSTKCISNGKRLPSSSRNKLSTLVLGAKYGCNQSGMVN